MASPSYISFAQRARSSELVAIPPPHHSSCGLMENFPPWIIASLPPNGFFIGIGGSSGENDASANVAAFRCGGGGGGSDIIAERLGHAQ